MRDDRRGRALDWTYHLNVSLPHSHSRWRCGIRWLLRRAYTPTRSTTLTVVVAWFLAFFGDVAARQPVAYALDRRERSVTVSVSLVGATPPAE